MQDPSSSAIKHLYLEKVGLGLGICWAVSGRESGVQGTMRAEKDRLEAVLLSPKCYIVIVI